MIPAGYTKKEDGLEVTNTFTPINPSNITSLRFDKIWSPADLGEYPTITVEVMNGETVVATAQLEYPQTYVEWKNLPYADENGIPIDYTIREIEIEGYEVEKTGETESYIEEITSVPSNNATGWDVKKPSFIVTRTTRQGGAFVIWTLNHLPVEKRGEFLGALFDTDATNDQPIRDLQQHYGPGATPSIPIVWLEGSSISTDIYPDEDGVGKIEIEITFNDDGTIATAYIYFEKQNTWTHFAYGHYSSKSIEFTNTYNATGSWIPEVTKVLAGRTLKEGDFTFELKQGDEVLQTKTNAADGKVVFDAIQYTPTDIGKTYTYTIVEVKGSEEGMTYDSMVVTITVTVEFGVNNLIVTPEYPEDTEFNNSYEASGSWTPKVTKALAGRALKEGDFTFELKQGDEVLQTKTNAADGSVTFDAIEYTQEDIGETYTYTIVEVAGSEEGMTYDPMTVTITVTVIDAGGGVLTVTPAYPEDIEFNNSYEASGSWKPQVTKALTGRALEEDEFTFELKQGDEVLQTKTNTADGSVTFDAIEYTQEDIGKTYTYTIVEVVPDPAEGGMTYDPMVVTITVTVIDAGNGNLTVTPTYPDDTTFNNVYKASGSWTPEVTKALEGRALEEGEFTFNLLDKDENIIGTASNNILGKVVFDSIDYTQADIGKTYTYTIVEVAGAEGGMTYDTMVVTITVTVVDAGGGTLTVIPEYPKDTEFNNSYTASGSWKPEVAKALAGRALKDGEFTFELRQGETVLQTKTNAADGKVVFDSIDYTQADIGKTYTYTIVEVAGTEGGMTYDPMVVTVTAVVTDAGGGTLTITPTYPEDTKFNNTYAAGGNFTPSVSKILNGREIEENEFTFELRQDETVLQTKTNAADGSVSFDAIDYTQEDIGKTYVYQVVELKGSEGGMTYDEQTVTITVTVEDLGGGELLVTAVYSPEGRLFTNTYAASGNWTPEVTKVLEGRDLKKDEFTFELRQGDTVLQTKTNAVDGNVVFDPIEYSQVDIGKTYTYTIVEVAGTEGGMTYDPMVVTITVTVADAGNGNLTITPTYSENTKFENTYEATGSWKPIVTKLLDAGGRELQEGEFTFELWLDGVKLQDGYNLADGTIEFERVPYSQDDIGKSYTYTIVEVAGTEDGMTYSEESIEVTVTIEDAGNGELEVIVIYPNITEFENSYVAFGYYTPVLKKVLQGRDLQDQEFEFELYMGDDLLETAKNDEHGNVTFSMIAYDQGAIGETYELTVVEVPGSEAGMTYSKHIATITIVVTDAGNRELDIEATIDDPTFVNTYEASGSYTPTVEKVLKGKTLEADAFEFELLDAEVKVLQTKTNAADGTVTFDALTFTQDEIGKTFEFSVREVTGAHGNIEYDELAHIFQLKVEDAGDGKLTVIRVDVDTDTPFVFTNTWQTTDVTATKTWVGAPDDKPTVWFKLQRAVGTNPAADVPGAPIMELDGETEVTWLNLDVKDEDGAEYIYRVVEVDKDGKDFVPEGYKKVEEGLKVTNTFIPKPVDPPAPTTKAPDPIVKTGGSDPYSALGMLLLLGGAGMFLLRRRKEDVTD